MSYEAWPSPDAPRGPLPRIDDLPIADQGYDQEAVREAFDAFYRHAAQLDASLKALEAVEAFRREATELRADLRSIRSLGYGGLEAPSWTPPTYSFAYERPRREIPAVVPRVAAEVALLIAVAVAAGVAHFRPWVIVAVMAAALVLVALSEWLTGRARYRVPEPAPFFVEQEGEPAPYVEVPPQAEVGWSAFEAAVEPEEAEPVEEEHTAIGEPVVEEPVVAEPVAEESLVAEDEAAAGTGLEPESDVGVAEEPVPEADAEQEPGRRWFRRRPSEREEPIAAEPNAAEPSSPVRVLPAADPWERGFDSDEDGADEPELVERGGSVGRTRRRRR